MPTDGSIPDGTPLAETKNLLAEFIALQKQQWKALDRAIYCGMTASEAQEYERRAQRIVELQRNLGANLTPYKDEQGLDQNERKSHRQETRDALHGDRNKVQT